MSSNLVIVAIPDENDRAWQVSSEKVPHLTLLFLGEADGVKNIDKIVEFVQHAAGTTLKRFYLPVDRRGELGDAKADVLFFKTKRYYGREIKDFRATLLQDPNIKTAYDAVDQHEGPWNPHLTLGYPETPAKNDDTDRDQGFYDVAFTKIAVWIGDYEGPELVLKDWDDEEDLHGSVYDTPLAAWSAIAERGQAAIANLLGKDPKELEHHGVKGMKWGRRQTRELTEGQIKYHSSRQEKRVTKKAARAEKAWEKNVYSVPGAVAVHNAMAAHFNERIGTINDKYKDVDFSKTNWNDSSKWSDREKSYMKDVDALTTQGNRLAVKEVHGTSPTGKRHAELSPEGDRILVRESEVKHAAEDGIVAVLKITRNAEGLITEAEALAIEEDTLAQSSSDGQAFVESLLASEEELEHYGIRGMRWGVRKEPPSAVAPSGTSRVPHGDKRKTKIQVEGGENHPAHEDAIRVAEAKAKLSKSGPSALSNTELREVANRVQLEQQVAVLTSRKGKQFVTRELQNEGKNLARAGVRTGIKKGAKRAAAVGALAI